jgi:arginase family enzyme
LGPGAIREALALYSTFDLETKSDLRAVAATDEGDLTLADLKPEDTLAIISGRVRELVSQSAAVVLWGGDNSITRPGCAWTGSAVEPLRASDSSCAFRFEEHHWRTH